MQQKTSIQQKQGAAKYLAAAASYIYPFILPLSGSSFDWGFYYDFLSPPNLNNIDPQCVDETLHRLIQVKARSLAMLSDNAVAFLKEKRAFVSMQKAQEHPGRIVYIFQLDSFFDLSLDEFSLELNDIAFKVTRCEDRGEIMKNKKRYRHLRIKAYCFNTKQTLQNFLKKNHTYEKVSHETLGKSAELFSSYYSSGIKYFFWKSAGESLQHVIKEYWRKFVRYLGCNICLNLPAQYPNSPSSDFWNQLYREGVLKPGLGTACLNTVRWFEPNMHSNETLLHLAVEQVDRIYLFFQNKEMKSTLISLQKMIEKFYSDLQLKGIEVDNETSKYLQSIYFFDAYGQKHRIGFFKVITKIHGISILELSLMHSVERIIAAMIESFAGKFSASFLPYHVCLLPLVEDQKLFSLHKQLLTNDLRVEIDRTEDSLKEKIQKTQKMQVPYVLIYGKNEQKREMILLQRGCGKKEEISMSEVAHKIHEEMYRNCENFKN